MKKNIIYLIPLMLVVAIGIIPLFFNTYHTCMLRGGHWMHLHNDNKYVCNLRIRNSNAGKPCNDSNQCKGKCMRLIFLSTDTNNVNVSGHCSYYKMLDSGYCEVINGKMTNCITR